MTDIDTGSAGISRRSARNPSEARHGRLPRYTATRFLLKAFGVILTVVLVSTTAVVGYAVWDLTRTAKPGIVLGNENIIANIPDVGAMPGGINFLLIGSDSGVGQGEDFGESERGKAVLNDVTILLHISQDHSHAEVISFPRDMLVPVPRCTDPDDPSNTLSPLRGVKINVVLSYGGPACVVKTVEELTSLTIPFAGVVQFLGVAALSEAVGGVTVCVAKRIEDANTGTYLDPGEHILKGIDALQFLRTRHGVGDGSDLGRISNQQVYLSALMRTLSSNRILNDPLKLYSIAKAALDNLQLSSSLGDIGRLISIAKAVKDIPLDRFVFIQYPTSYVEGGAAVKPNYYADQLDKTLQLDQPVSLPADSQNISYGSDADIAPSATRTATPAPGALVSPSASVSVSPSIGASVGASPAVPKVPESAPTLLDGVVGQSADQTRCSDGRLLNNQ